VLRGAGFLLVCLCIGACNSRDKAPDTAMPIASLMVSADSDGYDRALSRRVFEFPADHRSHPRFRTEWWYFTGNVADEHASPFGFQLTFFRFAIAPPDAAGGSAWRSRQIWMAHLAITDVARGRFLRGERFARDGLGLAGDQVDPFKVWVEDWSAAGTSAEPFPLRLSAALPEATLELTLDSGRAPIAHGDGGLDRKGPEPGNASYYYSVPRLAATGEIGIGGSQHSVAGSVWMDREWSTNALSPELAGWDWLALTLSDGRDLMLYRLRTRTGAASRYSAGTMIAADGTAAMLESDEFALAALEYWTSPTTGSRYPVAWRVSVPKFSLELDVVARIPNQEMDLSVQYWEGAVTASDASGGSPLRGEGYLELTGY
jgi:predicted secreted hydrolase